MVISLVLLFLVAAILASGLVLLPAGDRIARGVTFRGVDLSGLPQPEAREQIESVMARVTSQEVALIAGEYRREAPLSSLGIRPSVGAILANASAVGRSGIWPVRVIAAARARISPIKLDTLYDFDERTAAAYLASFAREINLPPADASARWDDTGERLVITPEVRGAKLDEPASLREVRERILAKLSAGLAVPDELMLPYREKVPRVTAEALAPVDTVLGTYTTTYATSTRNRASNVETAARAIDGAVVLPGEVFSYNEVVGPRTAAAGFLQAPVISNGQLTPGMGGGICQVSTTLYNAVLLAGLDIVARSHHSLPIHYAPPGRDATVSYGAIDFKFRNSTDEPIVVDAAYGNRRLTMRILGKGPAPTVRIELSNRYALPGRTITKKDPSLPEGTRVVESRGTSGVAVTVTRVFGDGPDARREVLSKDRYNGEPTIVRVGTGTAAANAASSATATTMIR